MRSNNITNLDNNLRMCVCMCVCVYVISEQLNQENGKSYRTGFFSKVQRNQKTLTKLNDKGVLNRSVVSGLIDGFVPLM